VGRKKRPTIILVHAAMNIRTKIKICETPRQIGVDGDARCECWAKGTNDTVSGMRLWTPTSKWDAAVTEGMPRMLKEGAMIRPCGEFSGILHVSMCNGECGIDVPVFEMDARDNPVYTERSYCYTCDRYEWVVFHDRCPSTPIRWISCGLHTV
jgi:hypothetical protein